MPWYSPIITKAGTRVAEAMEAHHKQAIERERQFHLERLKNDPEYRAEYERKQGPLTEAEIEGRKVKIIKILFFLFAIIIALYAALSLSQ